MNKLTNILLIGLLFFSDINAIKIKKNHLRLSSKKNSLSKIEVSKEQNTLQKTHKSKYSDLTPQERKKKMSVLYKK